jgi:mRNA interferase RelE/StbE
MSFAVEWHPRVLKFLRKIPSDMAERIVLKVKSAVHDPFRYLERYEGKDYYKLRVGEYRLLIDVKFGEKVLLVRVCDHRSRIYERG